MRKPYLYKEANGNDLFLDSALYRGNTYEDRFLSGKVIGEFTCDRIDEYTYHDTYGYVIPCKDYKEMCLSATEIEEYGKGKPLYGWHISDLKIYDKPKELSEFGLTRPFQSWGYVEEL